MPHVLELPLLSMVLILAACEPAAEVEPPSITFLSPSDGEEVEVGDLSVAIVIENFTLVDPKHGTDEAGSAMGYVAVALDDGDEQHFGSTNFTWAIDEAGEHTLSAELLYEDGDSLEEPATTSVTFTAVVP